ncbi:MAG: PD40 domain-containing protein [Planctomycetes bacterium]|nr:PD40 domain-containing protein [Planctomycetota bacterium]
MHNPCLFALCSFGFIISFDGSIAIQGDASRPAPTSSKPASLSAPGEEKHLQRIKQLTFGGQNAEAYFSIDDKKIIFQSTRPPFSCDQIFTMNVDGSDVRLVSTGKGKTTCSYYFPSGENILFASTHAADPECPPKPDYSKGYVWRVEPTFDIYVAKADGGELRPIVVNPGYDAEATISRDGTKIIFTSDRDGDLELYVMNADGSGVKRLTNTPGYDGGAFFSFDGTKIIYRGAHSDTPKEMEENRELLKQHLVRPTKLELYIMDADGGNRKQITQLNCATFAPFLHPDGKRVIFSSNNLDPKGREFNLWMIKIDGTGLEQITTMPEFDGFPMWSSDGKKLVFASNRNGTVPHETNIFIADWKD